MWHAQRSLGYQSLIVVLPMIIKNIVLVAAVSLLLNGCIFRDRSEVYQRSGSIEPIQVPSELNSVPLEPLYPIPQVQRAEDAFYDIETDGFVIPRPEPMSAEREESKVKIQRVGPRRWVLIEAPTSQVWPLAQSYLSSVGVDVAASQPASGLIETAWVTFKAQPEQQSQYRIRIEKGVSSDTTEIHVLQREKGANESAASEWPEQSHDTEREAWLLEGMANSLAGDVANNAASLLGQSVGGQVKAELFMDDEEPALRLRLSRDRGWATLAQALGKEGFKVWGENVEQGVFYVQYNDPQQQRGWFARWFLPEPASATETAPHSLSEVLQHLAPEPEVRAQFADIEGADFGSPLESNAGYLVVMEPRDDSYVVTIRSARGERLELGHNKRLLSVIRRNLI